MKKLLTYIFYIMIVIVVGIDIVGQNNVYTYILRLYNGTEVYKKDYFIELPKNWAIADNGYSSQSTRIVGHSSDGTSSNIHLVDLYEIGFIPKNLISKWSECDYTSWYPLTTYQGEKLTLFLCTYDFNTTTAQKPSLTLNDKNQNVIASAYEWKPYYHEQYLEIFKSIKINRDSSIKQ